jgi:hypothetical protein
MDGAWHRSLSDDEFLSYVVGGKGLSIDIENQYIRPNAQKPFTITKLEEEVKNSSVKDLLGREWSVKQINLLGEVITAFCLPNASGPTCTIRNFKEDHPEIMRHALENYVNYTLSMKLLNPGFVSVDATIDYYKSGLAKTNPMMSDVKVAKDPSGNLQVALDKVGIEFSIPSLEAPESLRIFGGYDGGLKSWMALGFEVVAKSKNNKDPEICGIGVEPKSTKTNLVLNGERSAEKFRDELRSAWKKTKISKTNSAPKKNYALIDTRSDVNGQDYSVYGYCFSIITPKMDQTNDDIYKARLGELKPYQPKFSIKKQQVVGH